MLKDLYIENLAIIKKLTINFESGLTVFTGETGAGKSIIIDAVNLILGNRGSKNLIRTGEKSCFVSAIFQNLNAELLEKLKDLNFKLEKDEDLFISREFFADSKNVCRLNGKPCTVSILKEISEYLITIHGQHDNHTLFNSDNQRYLIDKFGKLDDDIYKYKEEYFKYCNLKRQIEDMNVDDAYRQRQIDILKYQINDIEEADLKPNEEEELIKKKNYIQNYENIKHNILKSLSLIDGDNDTQGIISLLIKLEKCLAKCEKLSNVNEMLSVVKDAQYSINDIFHELNNLANNENLEDLNINEIEDRLDVWYKIKRKYGSSYDEIMDFYKRISEEFNQISMCDQNKEDLEKLLEQQYFVVKDMAEKISIKRKNVAKKFVEQVMMYLKKLNLPNVVFDIEFSKVDFNSFGNDRLEFFITTNVGESLKLLSKVASGGEIARVMLGIKSVLADNDLVDTVIFDEIDIGISGSTAYNMGSLMKKLAGAKQVIAITHSAQIASIANTHFFVSKKIEGQQTFTQIKNLDYDERKYELARILGGITITDITLKNAQELLEQTNFK